MLAWNLTERNLCVVLNGKAHTIPRSTDQFDAVMDAITDEDEGTLDRLLNAKANIETESAGRITFDGYNLYFNGEEIHNAIVNRLHFLWANGYPYKPLLRFMDNLMDNPSYRAVQELYGFLEACDLPFTSDGHFLAYKKVRDDFTDIHSGTFSNAVGTKVEIPRNKVDEDSERTCSYGLHVCSRSYLPCFGSGPGNKVVLVKVHPANVVAVPRDYNNAKMRVCAYEVVDDISDQFYNDETLTPSFYTDEHGDEDFDLDDAIDDLDYDWFDELYDDDLYDLHDELYGTDDLFDDLDDTPPSIWDDEDDEVEEPTPEPRVRGKLNEHQVREIRRLLAEGTWPIVRIADVYDVDEGTIRKIRNGDTWAWLTS